MPDFKLIKPADVDSKDIYAMDLIINKWHNLLFKLRVINGYQFIIYPKADNAEASIMAFDVLSEHMHKNHACWTYLDISIQPHTLSVLLKNGFKISVNHKLPPSLYNIYTKHTTDVSNIRLLKATNLRNKHV